MHTYSFKAARLLVSVCLGALFLAACGTPGESSRPSAKNCDPTGSAEARQACNK